jgi:histidine triad (HIT) family protein
MSECIFCRIIKGEISSTKVYEDDLVVAIEDIAPKAPVHTLIIPKRHIETLNELAEGDKELLGHIILIAKKVAKEKGIAEDGYRLVANCLKKAGQAVFHIHFHLLGGRKMNWPPG